MREVVSAIDIITNLSIQEIIRKNKFQMSFLDKFLLGKALIKMMITVNNWSVLDYISTSDDDDMNTGTSKCTCLNLQWKT